MIGMIATVAGYPFGSHGKRDHPLADGFNYGMLEGGIVVENCVDHFAGRHVALDRIEEAGELLMPMASAIIRMIHRVVLPGSADRVGSITRATISSPAGGKAVPNLEAMMSMP